MADGQLALNTNNTTPGLFFKDSNGALVKVGPVHVGTTAPNASPAVGGSSGHALGEQWLDTTGGTYVFKVWDGSAWRSETGTFVDVNGDVMTGALGIIAGSAGSPGLYFSGDTNTGLYSPGADQVAISTGGSGRLFINSSGQIKIGLNTGSDLLDVTADSTSVAGARITNINTNSSTGARLALDSAGGSWSITNQRIGAPLVFDNGTERLRITSAGLVGVGTSSPANLLHVSGTSSTPAIFERTSATGSFVGLKDSTSFVYLGNTNGVFSIQTPGSSYSDKLVVTSAGNVGVGTTSPQSLLHIDGDATAFRISRGSAIGFLYNTGTSATDAFRLQSNGGSVDLLSPAGQPITFSAGGSEKVRITSAGLVGVGVSSPSSVFHARLSGTSTATIATFDRSDGAVSSRIHYDGSDGRITFGTNTNHPLSFETNSTRAVTIDTSQRVGIGTSSATEKLTIGDGSVYLTNSSTSASSVRELFNYINPTASVASSNGLSVGIRKNDSFPNRGASVRFIQTGNSDGSGDATTAISFWTYINGFDNGAERMRLTGTGLGIGTTAPGAPLEVIGTAGTISARATTGVSSQTIQIYNNGTDSYIDSTAYGAGSGGGIVFRRNGSGEMGRWDTSGRLLVGTSTSSNVNIATFQGNSSVSTGTGIVNIALGNTSPGTTDQLGRLQFTDSGHNSAAEIIGQRDGGTWNTSTSRPTRLVFSTTPDSASSPVERLRITSTGQVLQGTTTSISGYQKEISSEGTQTTLGIFAFNNSTTAGLVLSRANGTQSAPTAVTAGQNISNIVGRAHDGTSFGVAANILFAADGTATTGSTPGRIIFATTASGSNSSTERMRINNAGNISINSASPDARLNYQFDGSAQIGVMSRDTSNSGTTSAFRFFRNTSTQVGEIATSTTGTAYNSSSDYRLKENIVAISDGIERLQQLKPSRFNFIADPQNTVDGFIAHEVQNVVPLAVTGERDAVDNDGNPIYQGIDQSKLVPLLTAALQEAVAKIESLEARLIAAGI